MKVKKLKDKIADFIYERFNERYIEPFVKNKKPFETKNIHGFTIMAVSCLMIETLQSFREGRRDTKGISRKIFERYFNTCRYLKDFKDRSDEFYDNVRCGILHQAETTGGWLIKRKGTLFDPGTKTINATQFLKKLNSELDDYRNQLKNEDWENECWINFRDKMNYICKNTEV